jgi:hypothetical protein
MEELEKTKTLSICSRKVMLSIKSLQYYLNSFHPSAIKSDNLNVLYIL